MSETDTGILVFGSFQLDRSQGDLRNGSRPIEMTPKAFALLVCLASNAGALVSKDQLLKEVWPGTYVADGTIAFHVHLLRHALGDDANAPRFIATVTKRGYRFIAPVGRLPGPETSHALAPTPRGTMPTHGAWRSVHGTLWVAGLTLFAALYVSSARIFFSSDPAAPSVRGITQITRDGMHKMVGPGLLLDGDQLYFNKAGIQLRVARDTRGGQPRPVGSFLIIDVFDRRREALAIRPYDRGAEDALWIVPLDGSPPRRVGDVRTGGFVSWSHDGERIAFCYYNSLSITDRLGAAVRQVATFSGEPKWPQWAPDDDFIRFTLETHPDRRTITALWDVNTDGTGLRRVIPEDEGPDRSCCGRWSPDGRGFVFEGLDDRYTTLWWARTERHLWTGSRIHLTQLTDATFPQLHSPVISSDGRSLIAIGTVRPELVYFDAGRRWTPSDSLPPSYSVAYSRDSRTVVYIDLDDRLWIARADGTDRRPLTDRSFKVEGAALSPDGTRIAFRGSVGGAHAKVYIMESIGGAAVPIVRDDIEQGVPSWSPDGRQVAFGDVAERFDHPTGSESIHIFDLERRTQVDLPGSKGLWTSRWSPDGRYLVALKTKDQELMLYNFASRAWRSLGIAHVSAPTWSRDGRYVYCDPEGSETWLRRVRIPDGALDRIADLTGYARHRDGAGLSRDGSPMILRVPVDLYEVKLDTSSLSR